MPELKAYNLEQPDELTEIAHDEQTHREREEKAAWEYYNGEMRPPLKVRVDQPNDNVIIGLVAKMVDQAVSMLMGEVPSFDIDENQQTPEEDRIEEVLDASKGPILLHNLALYGALCGHCFLKLLPAMDGEAAEELKLVGLDPKLCTVYWAPGDFSAVNAYKIQWRAGDDIYRQDIVRGEIVDGVADGQWLVRDLFAKRGRKFEEVSSATWGWDFPPLVDWQNLPNPRGYYGQPDLVNPSLNDRVNLVASNVLRILKYHAHPRTIVTGAQASQIQDTSVDQMWTIPNEAAQVFNLEMQSDLSSSMAMLNALQAAFYSEHRAVDMTSLKDKLGQLTNFGLRSLFRDALDKLNTKRALYGDGLSEMARRILVLSGMQDVTPKVVWGEALDFNGMEEIQEIQLEMGLGILSKETAAKERGRDWEAEQQRLDAEKQGEQNLGELLLGAFEGGG